MDDMVALPVGTKLQDGAFVTGKVLGQGGFGITYNGGDTRLRRLVAIKEFFPASCVRQGILVQPSGALSLSSFTSAKDKFLKEAQALAQFRHPNIVGVHNFFEGNNTAYMIMEFLSGKTLHQLVEQRGALSEHEARGFIEKLGGALEEVHRAKFLHRDIKPENIILCDDGRLVLIDFGLTKKVEESVDLSTKRLTGTFQFGSEGYAPPEQYLRHSQFGPFSDVYALGATLYFLLMGEAPLPAPDRMYADSAEMRIASASQPVNNAISKAMAVRAEQRPQTVKEFLQILNGQLSVALPAAKPAVAASASSSSNMPVAPPSRNKSFDASGGAEILIKQLSGGVHEGKNEDEVNELADTQLLSGTTLTGKYIAITLSRLFLNLPMKSEYDGKVRSFTILQATFQNLWKYPLSTWDSIKMVDSEEFQHDGGLCEYHEFCNLVLPGGKKTKSVNLEWPETELKGRAKSRGYIWFEKLPKNVMPHRILFSVNVFEPGQTSGWVKDSESLEFVIEDYEIVEVQDI